MRNIKYIKLTGTATPPGHTLVGEKPSNMANMAGTNGFLIRVSVAKRHATPDTRYGDTRATLPVKVLIIQRPHREGEKEEVRHVCVPVRVRKLSDGSCCSVFVTAKCNKLQMKSKLIFNKAHKC